MRLQNLFPDISKMKMKMISGVSEMWQRGKMEEESVNSQKDLMQLVLCWPNELPLGYQLIQPQLLEHENHDEDDLYRQLCDELTLCCCSETLILDLNDINTRLLATIVTEYQLIKPQLLKHESCSLYSTKQIKTANPTKGFLRDIPMPHWWIISLMTDHLRIRDDNKDA